MKHSKNKVYVPSSRDYDGGEFMNECRACRNMFMAEGSKTFCKLCNSKDNIEGFPKNDVIELTEAERRLIVKTLDNGKAMGVFNREDFVTAYGLRKKLGVER